MPITPEVREITLFPMPQGFATKPGVFQNNRFVKMENWWPAQDDMGSIEVVPGFTAITSSMGSFLLQDISHLVKSDFTRTISISGNTSVWTIPVLSGNPNEIKSGLTAGQKFSVIMLNDLACFFNGSDQPFKYDFTTVSDIGLTQPTVTSSTSSLSGETGNVIGTVKYFVSFVSDTTEGALSDAFGEIDAGDGNKIDLSGIPTGGGGVTARRLYRTLEGFDHPFRLATIEDNTTTTYEDDKLDSDLGAPPPLHGQPPPGNFQFAIVHFNRVWAAGEDRSLGNIDPNDIYYSDLQNPESWFDFNFESIWKNDGDHITGLARDREGILIFKNHHIYKWIVKDPVSDAGGQIVEIVSSDQDIRSIGTPSHWSIAATPIGHIFYYNHGFYVVNSSCEIRYISRMIEDDIRDSVNEDAQENIVATYWPKRRMYFASIPTSGADPDVTYVYQVDIGEWFKITEGFSAFGTVQQGTDLEKPDELELWAQRVTDPKTARPYQLDHPTATDFDGDTITAEAQLPPLFMDDPVRLTRWLWADLVFDTESSGNITFIYDLEAMGSTASSASISLVKANFNRWRARVNIGQQATQMQPTIKYSGTSIRPKIHGLTINGQPLNKPST